MGVKIGHTHLAGGEGGTFPNCTVERQIPVSCVWNLIGPSRVKNMARNFNYAVVIVFVRNLSQKESGQLFHDARLITSKN